MSNYSEPYEVLKNSPLQASLTVLYSEFHIALNSYEIDKKRQYNITVKTVDLWYSGIRQAFDVPEDE